MFRRGRGGLEVLLVHPGGPFFRNRNLGSWSIPKGQYAPDEDPLDAAQREFQEETGIAPAGDFMALGECKLRSGRNVTAWAFAGDCDATACKSNSFSMEWPPKSGRTCTFPEIDRAAWFGIEEARERIMHGQTVFLDRLLQKV